MLSPAIPQHQQGTAVTTSQLIRFQMARTKCSQHLVRNSPLASKCDQKIDILSTQKHTTMKTALLKAQTPRPFLQHNIRVNITSRDLTTVQRISYYLRKPQEEKWKYDITCATSCEVDDLLTNCDDAEAELWKGSTSKNRFERKFSLIYDRGPEGAPVD